MSSISSSKKNYNLTLATVALILIGLFIACAAIFSPVLYLLPLTGLWIGIFSPRKNFYSAALFILLPLSLSGYFTAQMSIYLIYFVRAALVLLFLIAYARSGLPRRIPKSALLFFALFVAFVALVTPIASSYVIISLSKLLFFTLLLLFLFSADNSSDGNANELLLGLIWFVVIGTILVYFFNPSVGYAFTYSGDSVDGLFSGVLSHPQFLAATLAISMPLLFYVSITSAGMMRWISSMIFVTSLIVILMTSSRTGLVATLFSLLISGVLYGWISSVQPIRSRARVVVTFVLIGCASVILFKWDAVTAFAFKQTNANEISFSGRDKIIADSWNAFKDRPLFGNGFQVPSSRTEHNLDTFGEGGSTSIEKSFFLTMILEECGIIGFVLFISGVVILVKSAYRNNSYIFVASFCAFLVVNLGEAVIFSPSGLGGLCWIICMSTYRIKV